MNYEIQKRTVIDRIKRGYIAYCRDAGVESVPSASIGLFADDFPEHLGINFHNLGDLILSIEKDPEYEGRIKLETADEDKKQKRPYYRVQVSQDLLPRTALSDKRPKIFVQRGYWCVSLPDNKVVKIGKKGTLKGELLGALGEAWGTRRRTDTLLDILKERVKNKATEGRPTMRQVQDAMKEINKPLHKKGLRTIKLVRTSDEMGSIWNFVLANAAKEARRVLAKKRKTTGKRKSEQ